MILPYLLVSLTGFQLTSENYHPISCTITKYNFAFISTKNELKVHGLWPDQCQECPSCGYPTCCNLDKFSNFTIPHDTHFIDEHWFGGQSYRIINTCNLKAQTLFEHEVLKHASCMNLFSTDYLNLVEKLFNQYYHYINQICQSRREDCSIDLDENFTIIKLVENSKNHKD